MLLRSVVAFLLSCLWISQAHSQSKKQKNDGKIQVILLQLNDIYEISPLDHGKTGGPARLATVRNDLKKLNPLTYTILAGDFLSPSAMGTLKYNGKTIAGLQMVETLDAAGVDLVTFGNHEFDIKQNDLNAAIDTSRFAWVSSNIRINDSTAARWFQKIRNNKQEPIPVARVIPFKDADGTQIKIGMFGLTIETPGKGRYEMYEDYYTAAAKAIKLLDGKCDFIVAVTHLDIGMDRELARRFPQIKLIIGGHEHINSYEKVGNVIIAKADANVKSVYIHSLNYNARTKSLNIISRLLAINNAIEEDMATKKVVDKWNARADSVLRTKGFMPCEILDSIADPLDGREVAIRTGETNLGKLIGQSMMEAIDEHTDCAIFNSGSIRLDDVLAGYITQYDIFRTLPFDNKLVIKQLQGSMIDSLLRSNAGREKDGSYLQYFGIEKKDSAYYINGKKLHDDTTHYNVAMNEYLATGKQPKLEFIGSIQPASDASPHLNIAINDMRNALIEKLKKNSAGKQLPKNDLTVPCY